MRGPGWLSWLSVQLSTFGSGHDLKSCETEPQGSRSMLGVWSLLGILSLPLIDPQINKILKITKRFKKYINEPERNEGQHCTVG